MLSQLESVAVGTRPHTLAPLSFLMVGPTGTGKTQVAALTASALRRSFYKIDMGNFKDDRGIWQLLGSPQGHYGGEGMLTRQVIDHPDSVVLFDEIEKASPEMFDWMLPMLDNGEVRDRRTDQVASFSRTLIFFTSNLLTEVPEVSASDQNSLRDLVLQRRFLRQEFVARMGTIVPFMRFNEDQLAQITEKQLSVYLSSVSQQRGTVRDISIDRSAIEYLVARQDPKYGARNVQSSMIQYVEPALRKAFRDAGDRIITRIGVGATGEGIDITIS